MTENQRRYNWYAGKYPELMKCFDFRTFLKWWFLGETNQNRNFDPQDFSNPCERWGHCSQNIDGVRFGPTGPWCSDIVSNVKYG